MDDQKKKTLSELYFIRAILSNISQKVDAISVIESTKKQLESNENNEKYSSEQTQIKKYELTKAEEAVREMESQINKIKHSCNRYSYFSPNDEFFSRLLLVVIPVALFYICLSGFWGGKIDIVYNFFDKYAWVHGVVMFLFGFIVLCGLPLIKEDPLAIPAYFPPILFIEWWKSGFNLPWGIGFAISLIIFILSNFDIAIKSRKSVIDRCDKLVEEKESVLKGLVNRVTILNKELALTKSIDENQRLDIISKKRTEIKALNKEANKFHQYAKNHTAIDERDWEHLDIIIYELETGRAETIKEALQQADLLIRHNEIKQAIAKASAAICFSIEHNMSEINYSIQSNLARIHDDFASLDEEQRKIQESLDNLVSAAELSNALKSKANVSSAQLAEDVRHIKDLALYGS